MYSLKEASMEYVTALDETEKKLSSCPAEVGMSCCIVTKQASKLAEFSLFNRLLPSCQT